MLKFENNKIIAAFAAVLALVCAFSAKAADNSGSIQGIVKSSSGEALSGAFVKAMNEEKRVTFMVISRAQGKYSVENLPAGKYSVQGIGNGFQSKVTPVTVIAGKPVTADLSLTAPQVATLPNGWPGR